MRLAAALLLAAAAVACAARPPATDPGAAADAGSWFVSEFHAQSRGAGPTVRFRGVLAWDGAGRARAEIAAPTVAAPLILVITPRGVLAAAVADRLLFRGEVTSPIFERLSGVPVGAQDVPRLLDGTMTATPGGCAARRRRYRPAGEGRRVATRLGLRCDQGELRISLGSPRAASMAGGNPFSLDPMPGFREVSLDELAARVESGIRGPR